MYSLKRLTLAFGLLLMMTSKALQAAQLQRTEELMWQCQGKSAQLASDQAVIACASYLDGFINMHALAVIRGLSPVFCIPNSGISLEQAVRVFLKWADDNPEELHKSARVSVLLAMRSAFPCKKE